MQAPQPVGSLSAELLMGDIQRLAAGAEDALVDVLRYFAAPRDWWPQTSTVLAEGIGEVTISAATVSSTLPRIYKAEYVVEAATFQELYWLLVDGRSSVDPNVGSIEVLLRTPLGEDAVSITLTRVLPVAIVAAREVATVSLERWLEDGRWVCAQVGPMSLYYERHLCEAGGIGLEALRADYRKGGDAVKANMILAGMVFEPLTEGARSGRGDWKIRSLYQCELNGGVYDWMVNVGFAEANRNFAAALHVRHQAMQQMGPAFGSCGESGPARQEAEEPLVQEPEGWSFAGSLVSVPMGLVTAAGTYAVASLSSSPSEPSSVPAEAPAEGAAGQSFAASLVGMLPADFVVSLTSAETEPSPQGPRRRHSA